MPIEPTVPTRTKPAAGPLKPASGKPATAGPAKPPARPPARPVLEKDRLIRAEDCPAPAPPPAPPAPPPVPVAANASEAVAIALRGEAVKLPVADGEPMGLALRELLPRGDMRAFEAALGGQRFEIMLPEGMDPAEKLGRTLPMVANLPPEVRSAFRRLTLKASSPERLAYVCELADARGKLVPIEVTRAATPADAKTTTYTIADRHGRFELVTTPDERDPWEVAQAFHLWAMIPVEMRAALKTIKVEDGANPTDAYWAEKYNKPGFESAASGGNGAASFWYGTKYLKQEFFMHEFGHVLGQTLSSKNELYPDGWKEAIEADDKRVTAYGENSPAEDFADSFWIWLTLRNGGTPSLEDPPADLAAFTTRWPRRAALLESIFKGEFRPQAR